MEDKNKLVAISNSDNGITEAIANLSQLKDFGKAVQELLAPGIDTYTLASNPKPMLSKSGAEKLCIAFGVRPAYEMTSKQEIPPEEDIATNQGYIHYEFTCRLVNFRTDAIVGEGVGSCNSREKQNGVATYYNLLNPTLKKAKKRALVDATHGIAGVSGVFGQDLDQVIDPKNPLLSETQKRAKYSSIYAVFKRITNKPIKIGKSSTKPEIKEIERNKDTCKGLWDDFLSKKYKIGSFMSEDIHKQDYEKYIIEFEEILAKGHKNDKAN